MSVPTFFRKWNPTENTMVKRHPSTSTTSAKIHQNYDSHSAQAKQAVPKQTNSSTKFLNFIDHSKGTTRHSLTSTSVLSQKTNCIVSAGSKSTSSASRWKNSSISNKGHSFGEDEIEDVIFIPDHFNWSGSLITYGAAGGPLKHARYGEKDGQRLNDRDTRYDDCRLAEWDLVSIPSHLDRRDLFQSHCLWSQV